MTGLTGLDPSRAISRRTLLLAGAGVAASAAIPKAAVAAGKELARPSHLDRSTWEPLVGTIVETRNRGYARVPLLLARVGDASVSFGQTDSFREGTFILVFHGPEGQPLEDATHVLFVPGVGKVDIWFSSATSIEGGREYVAVFSTTRVKQRLPRKPRAKGSSAQRAEVKRRRRKAEKGAKEARVRERLRLKQEREDAAFARSERKRLAKLAG
jgi:hypothetical protein